MQYSEIKDLKKYDVIKSDEDDAKYLIVKTKKDGEVKALPLLSVDRGVLIPFMNMEGEALLKYSKVDRNEVLFYLNQNNAHIQGAIKSLGSK